MRKSAIILILLLATSANATKYYVRTAGVDTDAGTSWATAWKTTSKVNSTISAGDSVYFGVGNWYQSYVEPPSGNLTYYACSTGTMATANTATIWSGDSLWGGVWEETTIASNTCYKASWTPSMLSPCCQNDNFPCVVGGDSLYLRQADRVSVAGRRGYYHYDPTNDLLYVYPYIAGDPDVSGHLIKASMTHALLIGRNHDSDSCTFFGLNFKMGTQGAVMFTAQSSYYPDQNLFIHCNLAHATHSTSNNSSVVYSTNYGTPAAPDTINRYSYGNKFIACTLYSANSTLADEGQTSAGNGFTMYGVRQTLVDSCYFYLLPGSGVMWKGGGNQYYGNTVRFSEFIGTDSMPYKSTDGGATFTKAAVEQACGQDRDSVYGCIFVDIYEGSALASREGDCNWETSVNYGGEFWHNNTVWNCNRFLNFRNEQPEAGYYDTDVKHNVFMKVISASSYWTYQDGNGVYPLTDSSYCDIDSNWYYDPTDNEIFYYRDAGNVRNFSYWQTMGYDINGDTVNVNLTDPTNGDFSCPTCPTINVTYGGRTWNRVGALQGATSPSPTRSMFLK